MQNDTRTRTETVFHAARQRAAGAERAAYLDGACGDDCELRARVEALLAAHDEANDFLEGPALAREFEGPGAVIDDYKLLQQIGEGGMGVVYMAEQEQPVRRKVALKIIKLGMDTRQVIARFEAERQALALMDHANIARVLGAGSTEVGRPYFVMELVRGVPINEYCDTHKLSTEDRLALFVDVCRAVQHAHQKGVIHRDLKPTNVMVTSHDGTPVPKIIDFGVAKATNQRLTERTLFTEFRQLVGTPEYMSPEQAELSGIDVDTRSDIYALGVLLYQLLTGTTPVDSKELREAGFEEMTRMIREDEPQAPSTRVTKLVADGQKIATHGNSDASGLSRLFKGDLDWIVMKALEKDRTRRYETACAFAEDVVRHLKNRPVEAGPPGALYRARKFVRRNRTAMVGAAVFASVVGLGLAGTTAGFVRARAELERSTRIGDSLQDVLAVTGSSRGDGGAAIDDVRSTVRDVFGADHATYAAVLDTLSDQLHDAGDFEAATDLCRESLSIWKQRYGERHPNVGRTLARLGSNLRANGDDEEAEQVLRDALEILNAGPQAAGLGAYDARVELADLLGNRGEFEQADELLAGALATLRASPSPARFRIIQTLEMRTIMQLNSGSDELHDTTRAIYDESHAFYPDSSPLLAISALGLGRSLVQAGDVEAAEGYLREAVTRLQDSSKPLGFYFVLASDSLFQLIRSREDLASVIEADDLLRDLIAVARGFWRADEVAANLRYYAKRMVAREQIEDAVVATTDAFQVLVDAGHPADQRDSLRGDLLELCIRLAFDPDLDPSAYATARSAVDLALQDDVNRPVVRAALGAVLYRQGEHELAATTLGEVQEVLGDSREGRKLAPVAHAFRALANAQLGHGETAAEALEAFRAEVPSDGGGDDVQAMLREVESVVESKASTSNDH